MADFDTVRPDPSAAAPQPPTGAMEPVAVPPAAGAGESPAADPPSDTVPPDAVPPAAVPPDAVPPDAVPPGAVPADSGPAAPEYPSADPTTSAYHPLPPAFSTGAAAVPAPAGFIAPDASYGAQAYPPPGYPPSAYPPDYPPQAYGAPGYPPAPAAAVPGYGGYSYGAPAPPAYPLYVASPKTNGMAIASLVVSVVGIMFLVCYGLGAIVGAVGAVLGHVARKQIRQRQESGDGMALAGVIVGWIATGLGLAIIAVVVVGIIWATTNSTGNSSDFDSGFDTIRALLARP